MAVRAVTALVDCFIAAGLLASGEFFAAREGKKEERVEHRKKVQAS